MKTSLLPLFIIICFCSCSSTRWMSLNVVEPAPVTLSNDIRSAGLINRSQPDQKTRVLDAVDKILTLEGARLDRDGAMAGLSSLQNELTRANRFDEVKILEVEGKRNERPASYPPPLDWETVLRICKDNDVGVLFSLELFDTDSHVDYAAAPVKMNTPVGKIPVIHQEATLTTRVKTGWRIYEPHQRVILDESSLSKKFVYSGKGINPAMAADALISRKEAVRRVATEAGQSYAYSVIPQRVRVSRQYYVRGSDAIKSAGRKADTGNWDGAAKIWLDQTSSTKRKAAGRACYNMAVSCEINGDLDNALKWARKAYEDYNVRMALFYIHILEDRKANRNVLERQQLEEIGSR